MDEKKCTKCGEVKDVSEFYKNVQGSGGLNSVCKLCKNKVVREYRNKNAEVVKANNKKWKEKNPHKQKEYNQKWISKNPNGMKDKDKKWRLAHPEKVKYKNSRIGHRMSVLVRRSLKNCKKGHKWEKLLNYTVDQLQKHIEKQFTDGMSWDRFFNGEIHIDHIIPLSVHNFNSPEDIDFKKAWSLKNLQPMWAKENIKKSNKLSKPFQPSLTL